MICLLNAVNYLSWFVFLCRVCMIKHPWDLGIRVCLLCVLEHISCFGSVYPFQRSRLGSFVGLAFIHVFSIVNKSFVAHVCLPLKGKTQMYFLSHPRQCYGDNGHAFYASRVSESPKSSFICNWYFNPLTLPLERVIDETLLPKLHSRVEKQSQVEIELLFHGADRVSSFILIRGPCLCMCWLNWRIRLGQLWG